MANSKSTKVKSSKQVKTAGKTAAKAKTVSPEPHQLAQDAVDLKAKLDDENLKKKLLKEAMVAIREAIRYREEQEEAERVAAEEAAEAERLAAEEEQRRLEDAEDAEDDDFDGTRDGSDDDEDSDDDDSICSGDASVSGLDFAAIQRKKLEDAEDAEDEDYDDEGSVDDDDDDDAASLASGDASVRGDKDDDDMSVRGGGDDDDASVASLASGDASVLGFKDDDSEDEPEDAVLPAATVKGTVSASFLKYISAGAKALPARPKPKKVAPPPPEPSESESEEEAAAPAPEDDEDDAPAPPDVVESEEEEVQDLCSESDEEEEDARVEVVVVPARVGRPAPSFEGLVALRESPDYWEVEAALAASGCSLEGAGALPPLLVFDRGLVSSARVGAVTVTVDHKSRDRDVAINEDGDIAAQTAKCVRTIRDVSKKLAPVKIALREFQGRKFVVDGGKVTVGAGKPAVYGNTIAVDRGLWDALAVEQQDAVLDAGAVVMRGSAPATEMLTVRDVGKAPAAPRGKAKRAAPAAKRGPAKKKLSAVVRQERGCTYYK